MKLFSGLTAGVSLAAFMAVSVPAQAQDLLASESLDRGYGHQPTAEDKKKDDKKKKGDNPDGGQKGDKEGSCGDHKKGDKEGSCGEGSCG